MDNQGFVINQPELTGIKFGKYDLAYGGCGAIAAYNALLILDSTRALDSVVADFEKTLKFGGKFGVMPWDIIKFFKNLDYKVSVSLGNQRLCTKSASTIFLYTYNGNRAHYVASYPCLKGTDFPALRFFNDKSVEYDIRTLSEFFRDCGKFSLRLAIHIDRK